MISPTVQSSCKITSPRGPKPVSYTHLDVYKRQRPSIPDEMVISWETGIRTCDIYRHLPLLLSCPIPNNLRMQRQGQILEDASFRLLKGEHIGLIGANGEGKSTFLNIITGKIMPDQGKITWSRHVKAGYLDQHSVLKNGMTIREVLRTAFDQMYALEQEMLKLYEDMAAAEEERVDDMMEEAGEIQQMLETGCDFLLA